MKPSVTTPLVPDIVHTQEDPLIWSFTDGVFSWTPANVPAVVAILLSTDTSGNITEWQIGVEYGPSDDSQGYNSVYNSLNTIFWGGIVLDRTMVADTAYDVGWQYARVVDHPGTWTTSSAVPTPSAVLLLGAGLTGLAGMRGGIRT